MGDRNRLDFDGSRDALAASSAEYDGSWGDGFVWRRVFFQPIYGGFDAFGRAVFAVRLAVHSTTTSRFSLKNTSIWQFSKPKGGKAESNRPSFSPP